MKYLSLFSGIGGFELGIQQAYERLYNSSDITREPQAEGQLLSKGKSPASESGKVSLNGGESSTLVSCIGYSEIDKYATQIYQKHFPNHKNYGNITRIQPELLPSFDLLVGGFPCQSFSIAGKRKGFEDTRGTLFFEIARIIKEKQPRLLLLENVKGLLSHGQGDTFRTIISTLDELGYDLQWQVLNSKNFGVPQNRERVFIVGHLRGTSRPEVFPITGQGNENSTIGESTKTTVARTLTGGGHTGGNHSGMTILRVGGIYDNEKGTHQAGSVYDEKGISGTLDTMQGGNRMPYTFKDSKIRRLTPTECERLQGFPDGWTEYGYCPACEIIKAGGLIHSATHNEIHDKCKISDTQRYKCLGNAVTVNVIQAIMERLLK